VRQVLYEQLKLDDGHQMGRTPETHEKSTSKATLQQLPSQHPLPKLVSVVPRKQH
jgi:DNA polymerase I-like protein with 3'-5' exonuclease and polymerase domains